MENNKSVRLVDELGRIVLPLEARLAMDWGNKTPVEIWVNPAENAVVIKRHTLACAYCGSTQELKAFNKKHICPACQTEITKL